MVPSLLLRGLDPRPFSWRRGDWSRILVVAGAVPEMVAELRQERLSSKTSSAPGAPLSANSVVTVAGGCFAPGHLGELTRGVPFEMVDASLAEPRAAQQRLRLLPSRVVVYLLLTTMGRCGRG